jgi:hypothetical protein
VRRWQVLRAADDRRRTVHNLSTYCPIVTIPPIARSVRSFVSVKDSSYDPALILNVM